MRAIKRRISLLLTVAMMVILTAMTAGAAGPQPIDDFDLIATPFGIRKSELVRLHGEPKETRQFEVSDYRIESALYERSDGRKTLYCFVDGAFAYAMEERTFYDDSNDAYKDFVEQADEMTLWYDEPIEQGTWTDGEWTSMPVLDKSNRFTAQWNLNTGKSEISSYWQEIDRCVMSVNLAKYSKEKDKAYILERHYYDPAFYFAYQSDSTHALRGFE